MSCQYRHLCYHRSITTGNRSDGSLHPPLTFPTRHCGDIRPPFVASDGPSSSCTLLPTWDVLRTLLHAPSPATRYNAVKILLEMIDAADFQPLPLPLTDTDIAHIWHILLLTIGRPSPSWWKDAHSEQQRALLTMLFLQASNERRQWMWATAQAQCASPNGTPADTVTTLLRWNFPLWMIPNSMTIMEHALTTNSRETMSALLGALHFWFHPVPPPPPMATALQTFLTEVLVQTRPTNPITCVVEWSTWIHVSTYLARIDPTCYSAYSPIAQSIFTIGSDGPYYAIHGVLTYLDTARPFANPWFYVTIESILRRCDAFCHQAAGLLLDAICHLPDPAPMRHIIDHAGQVILNRSSETGDTEAIGRAGAIAILQTAMRYERAIPFLRPYLAALREDPNIARDSVRFLATAPYHPNLTDEVIALACTALGTPDHPYAITILRRAWGTIHDESIITLVRRHADRFQPVNGAEDDRIAYIHEVLGPGLYHPQFGEAIVAQITDLESNAPDHYNAAEYLILGVASNYRPGQPIPPAVFPSVIQACRSRPERVPPVIIRAIWDTDPDAVADVIEAIVQHAPVDTIATLGTLWGKGNDALVAGLIRQIIHDHNALNHRRVIGTALTKAILEGIGRPDTDTDTIMTVWYDLIAQNQPYHLGDLIDTVIRRFRNIPPHRHAPFPAIIQTVYHRCRTAHTADTSELMPKLLAGLSLGWRRGDDRAILNLLDTFLHDTIYYDPPHRHTTDIIIGALYTLRFGWGRGLDRAIAIRLRDLMAWLDTTIPYWHTTDIGKASMLAITAGGGDPTFSDPFQLPDLFVDRNTIILARDALIRRFDLDG